MWLFLWWSSTVSRAQSHYEETVYFLPFIPRNSWYLFDWPKKDERLILEKPRSFAAFLSNNNQHFFQQQENLF